MNGVNSLSNFIGFSFDISRHIDSQQKKITLIALAIISGFALCYYFISSFWSNKQVEGQDVAEQKPGIKAKIRSLWNKEIKQEPVANVLPTVTGRMGALLGWQVANVHMIFQKLYEFTKTQDPEAQRVKSALEAFMNKNQTYPSLQVKLYNSSDLDHLEKSQAIAIQECLDKGVHYCDYKVTSRGWGGTSEYKELALSEKFVKSFNDKLSALPVDNLFDDAYFKEMLFQVVQEMELAINPAKKDAAPIQEKIAPKVEPVKEEPKTEFIPRNISGLMSLINYQLEAAKKMFKMINDVANNRAFVSTLFDDTEKQRVKTVLEAFAKKSEGYPGIPIMVYTSSDLNKGFTHSHSQHIQLCLSKGCHFYKENRQVGDLINVLGFSMQFISAIDREELDDTEFKEALLKIVNEMEKTVQAG